MQVRVALTEAQRNDGITEAFVIAWPLDNDPLHINADLAEVVRAKVGGLPVVLVALEANGDLYSHGRIEHALAVSDTGLDGRSWVMFEVPGPAEGEGGVTALRPRPPHPTRPLAA